MMEVGLLMLDDRICPLSLDLQHTLTNPEHLNLFSYCCAFLCYVSVSVFWKCDTLLVLHTMSSYCFKRAEICIPKLF